MAGDLLQRSPGRTPGIDRRRTPSGPNWRPHVNGAQGEPRESTIGLPLRGSWCAANRFNGAQGEPRESTRAAAGDGYLARALQRSPGRTPGIDRDHHLAEAVVDTSLQRSPGRTPGIDFAGQDLPAWTERRFNGAQGEPRESTAMLAPSLGIIVGGLQRSPGRTPGIDGVAAGVTPPGVGRLQRSPGRTPGIDVHCGRGPRDGRGRFNGAQGEPRESTCCTSTASRPTQGSLQRSPGRTPGIDPRKGWRALRPTPRFNGAQGEPRESTHVHPGRDRDAGRRFNGAQGEPRESTPFRIPSPFTSAPASTEPRENPGNRPRSRYLRRRG